MRSRYYSISLTVFKSEIYRASKRSSFNFLALQLSFETWYNKARYSKSTLFLRRNTFSTIIVNFTKLNKELFIIQYDGGRIQGCAFHSYRTWNTLKCHHKPYMSKPVCSKGNCMQSYPKQKSCMSIVAEQDTWTSLCLSKTRYVTNLHQCSTQNKNTPSSL